MILISKDPDAKLPYSVDWSGWLDTSETLVSSEWFIQPNGPELSEQRVAAGVQAETWIEGGDAGVNYTVTNRIETTLGKIDDRSFVLVVEDR